MICYNGEIYINSAKWKLNMILFAPDNVLTAENKKDLQNLVSEFNTIYKTQKLKLM